MKISLFFSALALIVGLMLFRPELASAQRPLGDSAVFATVPSPGFPEGIAVRGNTVYVTGPANFGIFTPSAVWAYNLKNGSLVNTFPITLQDPNPAVPKGLSGAAFGPDSNLYVLEPFMGVILRLHLDANNTQEIFAGPFPAPGGPGSSLINEVIFDGHDNLYVTDSFQATIYRVPVGGGTPAVWFTDSRLVGDPSLPFGVNSIRIDKNNKNLYLSVSVQNGTRNGLIYRLPLVANPTAADLVEFHRYTFPDAVTGGFPGPDGIAFGKSGKLYVAMTTPNQISVLRPDGTEEIRYAGPAANPGGALNLLPWVNPASIAFNKHEGSLLVTNHANLTTSPDPSLFAVFEVFVDDDPQPLP